MKVKIESLIVMFDGATSTAFVRIVNAVLCTRTEEELRKVLDYHSEKDNIGYYFKWGFGSTHFWVHQRIKYQSDQVLNGRILFARF